MYSFSSCWNSHRHTDGRAMLREIRDLGFEYAELSHGIRISLLPGILDAVAAGEMKISTLHNFCPLPMGVSHAAPNLYQFSSLDARERDSAFRHTLKTMETAARVKAPLVVLHMGSIEMKEYTDRLLELLSKGQKETEKFEKLSGEAFEKREQKKEEFVAHSNEMLSKLVEKSNEYGLKLGIENREALEEIPLENDLDNFFEKFPSPAVVYWHDTGHAQIKENLGFLHHFLHLESFAPRLAGFHIHDVAFPGKDHRAPGSGMIDFAALAPLVKPEHIKVFELSPSLSVEEVQKGISHIKKLWGDQ
ncbi:MAG: sugar phosphate isomerase/epimerase [Verrucomicrobiota bacterium]|nr:sugar phosphate isomerase/epimerase [Verrucomicrobiota bacterium]